MLDKDTRKRPLSPSSSDLESNKVPKTTHEYHNTQEINEDASNDLEKNIENDIDQVSFTEDFQEEDFYETTSTLNSITNSSSANPNLQPENFSISYEMQHIYQESLFKMSYWDDSSNKLCASDDGIHYFSYLNHDDIHSYLYDTSYDYSANYFVGWCNAVELYGSYASKQYQLDKPIFCYEDYKTAEIDFHVFFILDSATSKTIDQILLFDNYETGDKNDVQLRFSWAHPLANKDLSRNENKNTSTKEFILQKLGVRTENKKEQVDDESLFFSEMLRMTDALENEKEKLAPQEPKLKKPSCLEEEKAIMNFTDVRKFVNNPIKTTFQYLEKKHAGMFDVKGLCRPFVGKTQVPVLSPQEWQELIPITNPDGSPLLGAQYICLLARDKIPMAAQKIAKQYASHLKDEEHYDFSIYNGSKEGEHEIFFILKADYSICVGVFIFKKEIDEADFLKSAQKPYNAYIQKKQISEADAPEFLKKKLASNIQKHGKIPKKEISDFYSDDEDGEDDQDKLGKNIRAYQDYLEYNSQFEKYNSKISLFKCISFFSKAKLNPPPDMRIQSCLSVAWIHPFHRRQGMLKKLWPIFQHRYGVFNIDAPSKAMQAFTEKHAADNISLRSGKYFVC